MKNKILVGLILASLIGLVGTSGAFAQEKVKVVFWFGASQDERAAYEAMVDEFNRTHQNIQVRGMLVPQKYVERKLILSVAGGVPPDVVRFYTHLGGELMSRGGLEPLNDLIERDKVDLSDFWPVGLEQNSYQGKLYGMPWVMSPNALFYNKKLFAQAGIDPNEPPKTWKELEEYALKLTKRDDKGNLTQVGFADFLNNPTNLYLYTWQSGGELLSDDLKRPAFNSPEGIEALAWMKNFMEKEVGGVRELQTFSSNFVGATNDPFGKEALAMRVDSPFRIPDLEKYFPDLDFGVAPVPYNRVRTMEVVGNSLVIPRGSKHRDAAWEFVKFASGYEQVKNICKVAGRIPGRISAATAPEYYNDPVLRPFIDEMKHGRTIPVAPGFREMGSAVGRACELVLTGEEKSVEKALADAEVKSEEILAKANEDLSRYTKIPWATMGALAGAVLVGAFGLGAWWVRRQTAGSRSERREALTFYVFLLPWLVGFVVLTFGSVAASLVFSFSRWDVLSPARFVGLRNYAELFSQDPLFVKSLGNTLYYAVFTVPLAIIGGLAISVLLNQKVNGIRIFRTIYYLPVVVSGVATSLLWLYIFNPGSGLINRFLSLQIMPRIVDGHLALTPLVTNLPAWLLDPVWSKPAFIIMSIWGLGGAMIIYLAGLQGIPEELYEAADIDGAGSWKKFKNVTLPLLTPTIFFQLIIGTMATFQFFTQAYIMTNGGPQDSTLFYALYLFRNAFEWMNMGYASAMAWVLFGIVLLVTLIQFKSAGKWVYYEGRSEA